MRFRPGMLGLFIACMICMTWTAVASAADGAPAAQPEHVADTTADLPPHPAPPETHSQYDSKEIRRNPDSNAGGSSIVSQPQSMELPRVAGALAIVIGLIFALRWAGKKIFISPNAGKSTRAVQVLARSSVSPRQHILLLRVGQRVIVVGDSGAQMNSLSEINDPDEVAALLGQLQDEKSRLPTKAFNALFSRARDDMDNVQGNVAGDDDDDQTPSDSVDSEMPEASDNPAISNTREEITGLADRIRVLSKHFRGGQA